METSESLTFEKKFQIIEAYKSNRFEIPSTERMKSNSFDNFWFPQELSPWFYLKSYEDLPAQIKKRYNQLYALGTNEVFAIFESDFISEILQKKIESSNLDSNLRKVMQSFCDEELKHAKMFHQLNKIADPKLYKKSSLVLSKSANPVGLAILFLMKKMPDLLGAWIWISFFLEERSLLYSKYYLHDKENSLNSTFKEIHRLHMLEENYHVQLDEVIIDKFYRPLNLWKRKLAAWMLYRFVSSFKRPRRLSLSIAEILRNEFPESVQKVNACVNELPSLESNLEFQRISLGADATIRFKKMLCKFPEMKKVILLLP